MTNVCDPRTGRVERAIVSPSAEQLSDTAASLRSAQPAWEELGVDGRAVVLRRWATALRSDALSAAVTMDTGRPSLMEVEAVAGMAQRWASEAGDVLTSLVRTSAVHPTIELDTGVRPYPLVGVISPWNFPLLLSLIDAIPALMAGCAVLVKPSEVTPRFIAPLLETFADIPELVGVLHVVEGDGPVGSQLVGLVDAVCFTGSVRTGRAVGAAAAAAFIPAYLELGGKDPAIVLAGADLDRASSSVLWGGIANSGQACQSIERVYVEASAYDEFVEMLVTKADNVKLALPGPDDGHLGPLINPAQAHIIEAHIADAVERGAVVRTGGLVEHHDGGCWVRPTVLTNVDHSMAVMQEETFGPVLPVMQVADADEALRLANDSEFGLSGAVFAGDLDVASSVGRRLNVGAVSVNDAGLTAFVHEGEKDAFGYSGMGGSRMGTNSILRFVRKQTLMINHATGVNPRLPS